MAASRDYVKKTHDKRRAEGLCINNRKHGKAAPGRAGRCNACADAHALARKQRRHHAARARLLGELLVVVSMIFAGTAARSSASPTREATTT